MALIPGSGAGADQHAIYRADRTSRGRKTGHDGGHPRRLCRGEGHGFDPKIMRQLVKMRAMDRELLQEQDELLQTYRAAVGLV